MASGFAALTLRNGASAVLSGNMLAVADDDDEGVSYLALTSPSPALATPTTIVIGRR